MDTVTVQRSPFDIHKIEISVIEGSESANSQLSSPLVCPVLAMEVSTQDEWITLILV